MRERARFVSEIRHSVVLEGKKKKTWIRDKHIRDTLKEKIPEETREKCYSKKKEVRDSAHKKVEEIARNWFRTKGIRHIRVYNKNSEFLTVDKPFKRGYVHSGYHRLEIYETPDGEWHFEPVSVFHANKEKWKVPVPDNYKLIMALHKNDMVRITDNGNTTQVMRVCGLNLSDSNQAVVLAEHFEAGSWDKLCKRIIKIKDLKNIHLRPVIVTPTGKIKRRLPPKK